MFKKMFKSKTLKFNTLVPALAGLAMAFGIVVPAEVVSGILVVGNFILRFVTKAPISEK